MGVIESATRLFDLLAARDNTFTKHLTAGLPEAEIARLMAPTGIQLPAEAVAFYSRFGLPKGYQYSEDYPWFYGIYWMLCLEDAIEELLGSRRELWAEFFPEDECPESLGWFPLLKEDANLFVLDTANTAGGCCPVSGFFITDFPTPDFASLEAMFDTLYQWLHEGVLGVEHGGVQGSYAGDARRVAEIAKRFNPGLVRWDKRLESETNPPGSLR